MTKGTNMRRILITGGARGIGRGIAEIFAPDHATAITYTASPEEAEFVGLTAVVGTIQLYR